MKILAIIPARAGSKGIPGKNIKVTGGKPLIVWTIEAAKRCEQIDRIVVSSDSDEILNVAEKYGAEKLKRPIALAADEARSEPVVTHAIQMLAENGYAPDLAIYLQPTSPLRTTENLNEAIKFFIEKKADALISVEGGDNKILKAFIAQPDGFMRGISNNDFPFMNRQSLPDVFVPNGAIYIIRVDNFLRNPSFFAEKTVPFMMTKEESIDLDTYEDILNFEKLISKKSL